MNPTRRALVVDAFVDMHRNSNMISPKITREIEASVDFLLKKTDYFEQRWSLDWIGEPFENGETRLLKRLGIERYLKCTPVPILSMIGQHIRNSLNLLRCGLFPRSLQLLLIDIFQDEPGINI